MEILAIIALVLFINHYFALWAISIMIERESINSHIEAKHRYRWSKLKTPVSWFTIFTTFWGISLSIFFPVVCIIGLFVADIIFCVLAAVYVPQYLDHD